MAKYHNECHGVLKEAEVFPIEVDLSRSTFTYNTSGQFNDGSMDDEEEHGRKDTTPDEKPTIDLISTE